MRVPICSTRSTVAGLVEVIRINATAMTAMKAIEEMLRARSDIGQDPLFFDDPAPASHRQDQKPPAAVVTPPSHKSQIIGDVSRPSRTVSSSRLLSVRIEVASGPTHNGRGDDPAHLGVVEVRLGSSTVMMRSSRLTSTRAPWTTRLGSRRNGAS